MTKLVCAQKTFPFRGDPDVLDVVLYARADRPTRGGAGDAVREEIGGLLANASLVPSGDHCGA